MKAFFLGILAALIFLTVLSHPSYGRVASSDELANFQVAVADSFTKNGPHKTLTTTQCSAQNILVKYFDDQDVAFKGQPQTVKLDVEPAVIVVSSMSAEISDQDPHHVTFSVSTNHASVLLKVVAEFSSDQKSVKYLTQQDYSIQQSHGPLILDGVSNCGDVPVQKQIVAPKDNPKPVSKPLPKPAPPPIPVAKPEVPKTPTTPPVKPVVKTPEAPKGDPSPNLSKAKKVIQDDLAELSRFNFEQVSSLHQEIFGGVDAASVVKFFTDRVHRIVWHQDGTRGVMAAVYPGTDTMAVGSQLFNEDVPQVIRLSTYVHEARHTETSNGGWPHSFCPNPYNFVLNGSLTFRLRSLENSKDEDCDRSALGAYGVEYVFLRSIVNSCTNCSDKMKLDAKLYADYQTITRITDPQAVEHLLRDGNPDFDEASRELAQVLNDKLQSGLIFTKWLKRCEETQSCFGP